MDEARDSNVGDLEIQELIQNLKGPNPPPNYRLTDGLIHYKGRLFIGKTTDLRHILLTSIHGDPNGGHSGVLGTYQRAKGLIYWKGLKKVVHFIVTECDICQRSKEEKVHNPGLLQPLPIPEAAWRDISIDFIEGLPKSEGKEVIFVVVDRFTKYAHFLPLAHPFLAAQVAQTFLSNVYKLHGLPKSIVSDRDKVFTSQFWQTLFKALGVTLSLSTTYHPQSDEQTERVNQCLECYLRCMTCGYPRKWVSWLLLAE